MDSLVANVGVLVTHPREAPSTKDRAIDTQQSRHDAGDRREDRRQRNDERHMIK
jgi:hypothetical protein